MRRVVFITSSPEFVVSNCRSIVSFAVVFAMYCLRSVVARVLELVAELKLQRGGVEMDSDRLVRLADDGETRQGDGLRLGRRSRDGGFVGHDSVEAQSFVGEVQFLDADLGGARAQVAALEFHRQSADAAGSTSAVPGSSSPGLAARMTTSSRKA